MTPEMKRRFALKYAFAPFGHVVMPRTAICWHNRMMFSGDKYGISAGIFKPVGISRISTIKRGFLFLPVVSAPA